MIYLTLLDRKLVFRETLDLDDFSMYVFAGMETLHDMVKFMHLVLNVYYALKLPLTISHTGNIFQAFLSSFFICCLFCVFKINFLDTFFQECHLSVKQIGSRSGPTFLRA